MNTKISKLLGIGLAIATLASMLVAGVPAAAADPEIWANEPGPSTLSTGSQTMISGTDITDYAVANDGNTVYAVSSGLGGSSFTASSGVWKSTNGGATWGPKMTTFTGSAAIALPVLVAVAPDDANTVVVVDNNTAIVLTTDGGLTWSAVTGDLMTTINDIAISPLTGGVRYVALAGVSAAGADVQYLNMGAVVSSWKSMVTTADPNWAGFANIQGTVAVLTVAFSPNFASDKVMVALTDNATNGAMLEVASFSSYKWNSLAGFLNYPRIIVPATTPHPVFGSIALTPTYLGADESLRAGFVAFATGAETGGIWFVKDTGTAVTAVQTGVDFASAAYDGTNLVAGAYATNNIYYSANPTATTPTVSSTASYQKPGGANRTKVAFAGAKVVCGTSGVSSAFAVSKDLGATFNDVSLVDNKIVNIKDFAVSADGKVYFTISDDNVTTSQLNVWRKSAGTWEKVLSYTVPVGLTTAGYIARMAPGDANSFYIANTIGGTDMLYSNDAGEKSWSLRSMIETPKSIAVESAQVAYAVTAGGKVFKSVNSGFTWDSGIACGLTNVATITSIKKDQLIVGGGDGKVAWSTDGSASATTWVAKTSGVFSGTAGVVVATADKLDTGGFIYVGTTTANQDIRRWKVGTSTAWDDIHNGTFAGGIYQIGLRDGTLNAVQFDPAQNISWLRRILTPTTADASTIWTAESLNGEPATSTIAGGLAITQYVNSWLNRVRDLQSSSDGKVWSINGRMSYGPPTQYYSDQIYSFIDTVYKTGPAPTLPVDKSTPQTNPVTGRVEDIVFSWPRLFASSQSFQTFGYQLDIALDSGFKQIVLNPNIAPNPYSQDPVVAIIGPYQAAPKLYSFAPDTTYYWRVKMTNPMESTWSTTRSFSFTSLKPFVLSGPAMGTTGVSVNPVLSWTSYTGAKWYELTLSEDPSFAIPEWSHNVYNLFYGITADETLKYNTTYYWRVRGVTADPYVQGSKVITPAGPYVTGAFTTMAEPTTTSAAVIVSTVTSSAPPTIITLPPQVVEKEQPIPAWMLMTIIVIGAVLIIALIILIVRTRRVA